MKQQPYNKQPKPLYQPPQVTTYSTQQLMQQLGPARASSHVGDSFLDEELLFGEGY